MDWFLFGILVVTGFTACAEFGSFLFVHSVIRKLPSKHHIEVEKGLLKTFGSVMPFLMTISVIASWSYFGQVGTDAGTQSLLALLAAISFSLSLFFTLIGNVPINLATGKWDPDNPPENWKQIRNRWELFQGIRSSLLFLGFVLLCAAATF